MCIASKYVNELESFLKNIGKDIDTITSKIIDYDRKLSSHYHTVEIAKFNASEGYCLSRNLQKILQERRLLKDELYRLKSLHRNLKVKTIENNLSKAKEVVHEANLRSKTWHTGFKATIDDIEMKLS